MSELSQFINRDAVRLRAEEANGGVCSILVNSILSDRKSLAEREASRLKSCVIVGEAQNGVSEFKFMPILADLQLSSGVTYDYGFVDDKFGALVDDRQFIQLIEFHDKRREGLCSYAVCNTAIGDLSDQLLVTKACENRVILGVDEERGIVAAKYLLDSVYEILRLRQTRRFVPVEQRGILSDLIDIEGVVADTMPDLLDKEILARRELWACMGQLIMSNFVYLDEELVFDTAYVRSEEGSAVDEYYSTTLRQYPDGYEYKKLLSFPNAINQTNTQIFSLRITESGMTIESGVDFDRPDYSTLVDAVKSSVQVGLEKGTQKRVIIESLPAQVQQWLHATYTDLNDHFIDNEIYARYSPKFTPMIVRGEQGNDYLVLIDQNPKGIPLYSIKIPGRITAPTLNVVSKSGLFTYTDRDGNRIDTTSALTRDVINELADQKKDIGTVIPLMGERGIKKCTVVQLNDGKVHNFKVPARSSLSSNLSIFPVVRCPHPIR